MDPFIGEIRLFAGNFAPNNWAFCNGQLLPISQYTPLFAILGVTYGGDGKATFGLPNLQDRVPMHFGDGPALTPRDLGETAGTNAVTLLTTEMPAHTHAVQASTRPGEQTQPTSSMWARIPGSFAPIGAGTPVAMSLQAINTSGGSTPHNNIQPVLGINFIIALYGIYPPRG